MTSPAPQRNLDVGATIADRYVVRDVLGEGGMGQVLRVEHLALGRPFALKMLRIERWSEELVRRFNREARALARITTPRVAQITDFGVDGEIGPFYVMELVDGETLEQRIERETRLTPEHALGIGAELCDALAEVHAVGIVHRDLKPSNVGLPASGPVGVKLLDFGLAAAVDDAFLSKITESQQILGSLPYMAPEQFNAMPPTPAMDVYAVGIVLFEALTGKLPFHAPSTAALIHQILAAPLPPLPPGLPQLLRPLLEQLLAKEPRERFASAEAAARAMREVRAALGVRDAAAPGRSEPAAPLPKTSAARPEIGSLPTLRTPLPAPASVPQDTGMRWRAGGHGPAGHGPSAPGLGGHGPSAPGLGGHGPSAPPRPGPEAVRWRRHLLVLGVIGIALGGLATITSIIALSAWGWLGPSPSAAPVEVADPAPRAVHPQADHLEPVAPEPSAALHTERADAPEPLAGDTGTSDVPEPPPTVEALAPAGARRAGPSEPDSAASRPDRRPRVRPLRPPLETIEPRSLPPAPEPARSPSDEGIIRQW